MGDAGPTLPALGDHGGIEQSEITVLVTGFGPFKTFHHNPSQLITALLPATLHPTTISSSKSQPTIHLLIPTPNPLPVSYPKTTTTLPTLLSPPNNNANANANPDYILHLGMAAGRRHYALETLAHRDGYTIQDIDGIDGVSVGSQRWQREGCPAVLSAAWDRVDVLARWREELSLVLVQQQQQQHEQQQLDQDQSSSENEALPDVRLSNDAGRFLCDFIYYESLSLRWKEEQQRQRQQQLQQLTSSGYYTTTTLPQQSSSSSSSSLLPDEAAAGAEKDPGCSCCHRSHHHHHHHHHDDTETRAQSKQGKVAFLHVPGDADQAAVERGVRVTVAAIRALVASWEEGFRRDGRVKEGWRRG